MEQGDGLITAWLMDGRGGGREVDWGTVKQWTPEQGLIWVHMDYTHAAAREWVEQQSGLDPLVAEALLVEETRPRSVVMADGLLVTLRGVNLNPGADPEDMVSIRLWVGSDRIISTRRRQLLSISDLRETLSSGRGPETTGAFLVDLVERLVERMADVIHAINDTVDRLEDEVLTAHSHQLRPMIARVRREAISLKRYLAPQRDAMSRLYTERVSWLDESLRMRLREIADRTTRYIEDLDSARERAAVVQEELMSRLSEQMDSRMYVLSIVATVFLPLGFLTGLLGVNLGGIPGADYPGAFVVFAVALVLLVVIQLWLLRLRRWFF